jgi:hypothetical protein
MSKKIRREYSNQIKEYTVKPVADLSRDKLREQDEISKKLCPLVIGGRWWSTFR